MKRVALFAFLFGIVAATAHAADRPHFANGPSPYIPSADAQAPAPQAIYPAGFTPQTSAANQVRYQSAEVAPPVALRQPTHAVAPQRIAPIQSTAPMTQISDTCGGCDVGCSKCSNWVHVPILPKCVNNFVNESMLSAKRRNVWPRPFTCQDRAAVYASQEVMIKNGWRRENTFGDAYFTQDQKLNEWGRRKIESIFLNTPVQYRAVFVQNTRSTDVTGKRVESVHESLGQLALGRPIPPVFTTFQPPVIRPADEVEHIGQQYRATAPTPRLPGEGESGGMLSDGGGDTE